MEEDPEVAARREAAKEKLKEGEVRKRRGTGIQMEEGAE